MQEDRVPNTPDPCDCGKDDSDMRTGPIWLDPRDSFTVKALQSYGNCPECDNTHKDRGPTINKAILLTRPRGQKTPDDQPKQH